MVITIMIKMMTGNHELSFDPALRGLEQELSLSMGRCGHTGFKRIIMIIMMMMMIIIITLIYSDKSWWWYFASGACPIHISWSLETGSDVDVDNVDNVDNVYNVYNVDVYKGYEQVSPVWYFQGGAATGASPMHIAQSPEKAMDGAEV